MTIFQRIREFFRGEVGFTGPAGMDGRDGEQGPPGKNADLNELRAIVREEVKKQNREVHISEVIGAYGLIHQKVDKDDLPRLIQAELTKQGDQ